MEDKKKPLLDKNERRWLIGISLAILLMPLLFSLQNKWFSLADQNIAYIGDSIGGITAPFIGLVGSVLVYIAFKSQYQANQDIRKQFQEQNDEQLYFRLIDGLYDRIKNSSVPNSPNAIVGLEALKSFSIRIRGLLNSYDVSKIILHNNPELVDEDSYAHLFQIFSIHGDKKVKKISNSEKLKEYFIEIKDSPTYLILLKILDNVTQKETQKISSKIFYYIPFNVRQKIYKIAYDRNGHLLEGYFANLSYLLKFIYSRDKNQLYKDYFLWNLTTYEKVLIFYYCASGYASKEIKKIIKEYQLLDSIDNNLELLFNMSTERFHNELKLILDTEET